LKHQFTLKIFLLLLILSNNYVKAFEGGLKLKIIDKKYKIPIENATIIIKGVNKTLKSDSNGIINIERLKTKNYTIIVECSGYVKEVISNISIINQKVNYLEIELQELIKVIPIIEVSSNYELNNGNISTFSFSREEISLNPGSQGDIFRAISMLPGVTSSGGIYSAFSVRGQGVRDNVYIIDDIPITEISHLEGNSFFNDPNGGRFSILAPRVVDKAVFQVGTLSSEFGRKSASYLGLTIKEGNKENLITDGQIDLLGATLNFDSPINLLNKTTLFASIRYQNFIPLVKLVGLEYLGTPEYGDIIVKTSTEINEENKFNLLIMINPESFVRTFENLLEDKELNLLYLPNFKRNKVTIGGNLRTIVSQKSIWKNIAYYNAYFSNVNVDKAYYSNKEAIYRGIDLQNLRTVGSLQEQKYSEEKYGLRSVYESTLSDNFNYTLGCDLDYMFIMNKRFLNSRDTSFVFRRTSLINKEENFQVILPEFVNSESKSNVISSSLYLNMNMSFVNSLFFTLGLRFDYSSLFKESVFSPRINLTYNLDNVHIFSLSGGIYYQEPIYSEIVDAINTVSLNYEKIFQTSLAYKLSLKDGMKLQVEYWYKDFNNMVASSIENTILKENKGFGYGSGLDISFSKKLIEKIHGIVSYSFMNVRRNDNDIYGYYPFTFSQPHQISLMVSYQLDENFSFSTKFRYATGRPKDKYIRFDNVINNQSHLLYSFELIGKNQSRLPDFQSLDIRINYSFSIGSYKFISFIDIVNVLNKQISNSESFNYISGKTFFDGIKIFPTGGLKFEF